MAGNFFTMLGKAVIQPVVMLLQSVWRILCALVVTVAAVPADAMAVLSSRLQKAVQGLDESLDTQSRTKQEKKEIKQINKAVELLFYSGHFIAHMRQTRMVKIVLIIMLQTVSFMTTYRGLSQCFAALHWAVPCLLALVIQIGLTFLAATVSYNHAPKRQKWLLLLVLLVSIAFSYVGVSETLLPYADHVKEGYMDFKEEYDQILTVITQQLEGSSNPVAEVEGQYAQMEQLLLDAEERYGDEELKKAEDTLRQYKDMTIAKEEEKSTRTSVLDDGTVITSGGGTELVYVADPEAKPYINEAEKNIRFIEEQQQSIASIRGMLEGTCSLDKVTDILNRQLELGTILPEFTALCAETDMLAVKCRELAEKMGLSLQISLDLRPIVQAYRKAAAVSAVQQCPDYQEIYEQWSGEEYRLAETGNDLLDDTLAVLTVNMPTRLKEISDETAAAAYHSLIPVLDLLGAETERTQLTEAYEAYHLMIPIIYAAQGLNPRNAAFSTVVFAAIIALFNDGLAVLIGLWMEHRQINWGTGRTLVRTDLMPHLYPQFKSTVTPIIAHRLKGKGAGVEDIFEVFAEIVTDFLGMFELNARLISEGFSRYSSAPVKDPDMKNLCGFLITWGFVKLITPEQAVTMGLAATVQEAGKNDYMLLSVRGEGWLMEMLGSAAGMKLDKPVLNP